MTRWLLGSLVLTAAALAGTAYVYFGLYDWLPEQIPIHWNAHFEADGFVAKENGLWAFLLMPGVMVAMVLLTVVLPWLSPQGYDVDRFRGTYGYCMMLVVALFGYMHAGALMAGLRGGQGFDLGRWMVAGFFIFFALLGNVLGQVRRNFWLGIRTPWTLASEGVWNQTHRLAAWLFVAGGVLGVVAVLAGAPLLWCFVGFLVILVTVPVVGSFILYKRLARQGRL